MAISPKEAAELDDAERTLLTDLEAELDLSLRNEYVPGCGSMTFQIAHTPARVADVAMRRYLRAGWAVVEIYRKGKGMFCTIEAGTDGDAAALGEKS